ncbi:hypothetical protein PGB90_004689 [Kerria lacca]
MKFVHDFVSVYFANYDRSEEIGEVFDKWSSLSAHPEPQIKPRCREIPRKYQPAHNYTTLPVEDLIVKNEDLNFFKSLSLPSRTETHSFETYLDAWSKSLLAEFNNIIHNETTSDSVESADDDYDEVAGDSSEDENESSMRMKYRINKQGDDYEVSSSSPTVSPSTSEHSSGSSNGNGNTRRTSPPYISRMVRHKQRSHVASVNNKCDPVLVNVKIYPTEQARVPLIRKSDYEFVNGHHVYPAYDYCSSRVHNRPEHLFSEIGTQTSPTESRSSSFTWISDCSEDDHSSTTSSTEDSRRVGDSSGDSTPIKDEPESGIGTASPPRHYKYNKPSGVQKYRRKEVWEKLRRRQTNKQNTNNEYSSSRTDDIHRKSYRKQSTSVDSCSDPDLTVFKVQRPTCLPLASSLSPESSRETLPSPSATSLKLKMEPSELAVRELYGKSSSAPLLLKQNGLSPALSDSTKKKNQCTGNFSVS